MLKIILAVQKFQKGSLGSLKWALGPFEMTRFTRHFKVGPLAHFETPSCPFETPS